MKQLLILVLLVNIAFELKALPCNVGITVNNESSTPFKKANKLSLQGAHILKDNIKETKFKTNPAVSSQLKNRPDLKKQEMINKDVKVNQVNKTAINSLN